MSTRGVEVRGASGERLRVGWMVTALGVSSIESAVGSTKRMNRLAWFKRGQQDQGRTGREDEFLFRLWPVYPNRLVVFSRQRSRNSGSISLPINPLRPGVKVSRGCFQPRSIDGIGTVLVFEAQLDVGVVNRAEDRDKVLLIFV